MSTAPHRGHQAPSALDEPEFEPGDMPDLESYEREDDAASFADEFDPEDFLDG